MSKTWGLVVTCEHARRDVPEALGDLGLDAEALESHVAWDPGALHVATAVADRFGAARFLGEYTRLVADLNRGPTNPDVVPEVAFGVPVPANRGLSAAARADRLERYHRPYWDGVRAAVATSLEAHPRVLHLSVHSFTPEYAGRVRTVDLGVMFDPARPLEQAIADAWIPAFGAAGFVSRENEPYDGREDALVTALRRERSIERYAGIEVEINQRLLDRLDEVAAALEDVVGALLA